MAIAALLPFGLALPLVAQEPPARTAPPSRPATPPSRPAGPPAPGTPGTPVTPGAPRVPGRPAERQPTLKVGDRAPKLAIGEWIKGEPISELMLGKVYLIEFWATWCGPCMPVIPKLTALQKELGEKGLVVIGVTTGDQRNTIDKVRSLVSNKGDTMDYTVAFDDGRQTWDAFMAASGRRGIPSTFLVDRNGTLVFIGHPHDSEETIRAVVDGTYRPADAELNRRAEEDFVEMHQLLGSDPEKAMVLLDAWKETYPTRIPAYRDRMMVIYLRTGRGDDARPIAEELLKKYGDAKDLGNLNTLGLMWTNERTNPLKLHPELAIEIAKKGVELGKGEIGADLILADAYFMSGAVPQAIAIVEEAMAKAVNPRQKSQAEMRLTRYREPS